MILLSDHEFQLITTYVSENYGINLLEKKALIESRLQNVLLQKGFNSFGNFYNKLIGDQTGETAVLLINKLTTNHTYFLRESEHFDYFQKEVLPYLVKYNNTRDLRIWSAGCSSGEEPYTLTMIMADFFGDKKSLWDTKILATDISQNVLDIAVQGIYHNEQLTSIPEYWERQYFMKYDQERKILVDKIRQEVVFRFFNLNNQMFPFKKKFHTIFCRNVMIYFDANTKRELVKRFYDLTEPGGFLFVGHSESIGRDEVGYRYILPAVYRKE